MNKIDLYKIHISVFLFGFAGLFGKWISLDALTIVWGRVLFASIAFGFYYIGIKRNPFKLTLRNTFTYLFLGGLLAFHWWSFFLAIQESTVAIGLFSFATFPVFTLFLEPLLLKEKWKAYYIPLAFLSLLGIYFLLPEFNFQHQYFIGVIWGVASGLSFALLTIMNRAFLKKQNAIEMAFFQDLFAFIILSPFILSSVPTITTIAWCQLIVLGIIFTALAHVLFISSLNTVKASQASLIANMEPIYGSFFAFLLLNENISWTFILGASLILLAAYLSVYLSKRMKR